MWCRDCAQDVPGVVSLDCGRFRCPRCAAPLGPGRSSRGDGGAAAPAGKAFAGAEDDSGPLFDSWEMDERLRHIERVLHSPRLEGIRLLHGNHSLPETPHFTMLPRRRGRRPRKATTLALRLTAAVVFSVGLVAFSCGLALIGWSTVGGRSDLWTIGMTVTLAGQSGLLLGALLHLWGLRRTPRNPSDETTLLRYPAWSDDPGTERDWLDDPLAA